MRWEGDHEWRKSLGYGSGDFKLPTFEDVEGNHAKHQSRHLITRTRLKPETS
jgi:hypothetical protein